jgi:septal ring factor EnvC (AmiA/AmiB activator)
MAATIVPHRTLSAQSPQQQQAAAEQRLREQKDELDRVRREREELERQASALRTTAHDLSDEVSNLNRRLEASTRLVRGIDKQLTMISSAIDTASARLDSTETELVNRRLTLQHRAIEVYKRGPMFTAEALLSSRSFGELIARYKYLHDLTLHDQALVQHVENLRNEAALERTGLMVLQGQLSQSRADRAREATRLKDVQREQAANLRLVRQQAKAIADRIERHNRTIAAMEATIAALEEARKRAVAARPAAAKPITSSIKTSDYGRLDWPVDGSILYSYGKQQTESRSIIHWNGIGIQAQLGTDVHVVAAGKVSMVRPLGLYGLTIIVDHGAGDYTIYGSLEKAVVKVGDVVTKGQVIGTVGRSDAALPDHLYFEIRTGGRNAVDPMRWLRKK